MARVGDKSEAHDWVARSDVSSVQQMRLDLFYESHFAQLMCNAS